MFNLNPFKTDKDIEKLKDELLKDETDNKTITRLQMKIAAKGLAEGVVMTAGIVSIVGGTVIAIASKFVNHDEEEETYEIEAPLETLESLGELSDDTVVVED
jgi:hypothetical protein